MTYNRRGYGNRAPLTPPAELVGQFVTWSPKGQDGRRRAAVYGWCDAVDLDARTITLRIPQEVSPWQPNPERVVTLALSAGPFRVVSR